MSVRSVFTMFLMWNVHNARLTTVTSTANTTRMRMMSRLTIVRVARTLSQSIAAATGTPASASARSMCERTARWSAPALTLTAYSVMRACGYARSSWVKRAAGALNARICDPALPNSISSTTPAVPSINSRTSAVAAARGTTMSTSAVRSSSASAV